MPVSYKPVVFLYFFTETVNDNENMDTKRNANMLQEMWDIRQSILREVQASTAATAYEPPPTMPAGDAVYAKAVAHEYAILNTGTPWNRLAVGHLNAFRLCSARSVDRAKSTRKYQGAKEAKLAEEKKEFAEKKKEAEAELEAKWEKVKKAEEEMEEKRKKWLEERAAQEAAPCSLQNEADAARAETK